MSLAEPRPLPLRDYAGFSQDWHQRRFSVKLGITCLWQIYGRASLSLPFEKWMHMETSANSHFVILSEAKDLVFPCSYEILRSLRSLRMTREGTFAEV
jgi:lipopolysaccharide/colanic/teichoic acid biosynthesis glycosyltransferase